MQHFNTKIEIYMYIHLSKGKVEGILKRQRQSEIGLRRITPNWFRL